MRVLLSIVLVAFVPLGSFLQAAVWAADGPASKEIQKDLAKLRQQRFYRHGSVMLDNVQRFAQMEESRITAADRFMRAFYESRWDEVRTSFEQFPDTLADVVYDKMLDDLTGRNVPIFSVDDCLGLADACPTQFTTERIRRLGQLFKAVVPPDQEGWLKRALEKGSRRLGRDEAKRLTTGRVLLHGEFSELARQYLPSAAEAAKLEDEQVREEILKFLAAHEVTEETQQAKIAGVWAQHVKTLGNPQADWNARQRATDGLAELLGKAPAALWESWIRNLIRDDPAGGLRVASALGKIALAKQGDNDAVLRAANLRAQKALLQSAAAHADLSAPPWNQVAAALADGWIREAEQTFQQRCSRSPRPHVAPVDVLDAAPDGPWAKALPPVVRERIDVCLSKVVVVSDRYEEAVPMIVDLARRNPKAGTALAEEYVKAWAERHNPQVPDEIRKKYLLPEDARITVTPIMMERNIAALAKMMEIFRSQKIRPQNGQLVVAAFDVCYSTAEVYRRSHVEQVFGPVEEMDEDVFYHMIRTMTEGLSSRWRKTDVQKESGTRRSADETLRMVREGYQAAIAMIQQRTAKHPDAWRVLALAGSLLSDWGDFEYYQELAAETKVRRMEVFREKNNQAEEQFTRAAEAYARQVPKLDRGAWTNDVYLPWFHSLLGINTNGEVNLSKPLDRRALGKIHELIHGLPGGAAKAHVDQFARQVSARLEDTTHPLHEDLKYKYLAGSLVIIKDSPFSFQANSKLAYYDELLGELRLEARVDGPSTVQRDEPFGILLSVRHTEAIGRMADFGKYLVNEAPPGPNPAARRRTPAPVVAVYRSGVAHGRRDQLEMNIREALSLFFDIKSITFSPRDVQPRPTERAGWKETVLAYIHAKAKDASVDKIPRIQMSLEFLDLSGPVSISAESAETMIKVTDAKTEPRPFHRVDLTEVLDGRNLASSEEVLLEITATASGLVPELETLIDVPALSKQLPIARIDPHEGTQVREIQSWGDKIHPVSHRRWTIALDGSGLLKPPQRLELHLPAPHVADASVKYQTYNDMDLLDLAEPVAVTGPANAGSILQVDPATPRWIPYAVLGGGLAVLLVLGLAIAWAVRGRGPRPLRARDVFQMPARIDAFVVIQLLRSLGGSELVRLSPTQREEMAREIERIQNQCFSNGSSLSEDELRNVARKWLRAV